MNRRSQIKYSISVFLIILGAVSATQGFVYYRDISLLIPSLGLTVLFISFFAEFGRRVNRRSSLDNKGLSYESFKVMMILIAFLISLILIGLVIPFVYRGFIPAPTLKSHATINIIDNSFFNPDNGVNGGGSGTVNDPYIIENLVINAENIHGIWIHETTAYFVIRNCLIENGGWNDGIYLLKVVNGKIENVICRGNYYGIHLERSSNNNLTGNTCVGNTYGIRLDSSENDNLTNNTCKNNRSGVYLESSSNNTMISNTCENDNFGIYLESSSNNTITLNYLLSNVKYNAYDSGTNFWDNNGKGNYWDNWQPPEHPDADNNRIVDAKYSVPGGNDNDNFPLVIIPNPPTSIQTEGVNEPRESDNLHAQVFGSVHRQLHLGERIKNFIASFR